jgi:hypothetical protein
VRAATSAPRLPLARCRTATPCSAQAATHGINPTLYPKLGYDALADFAPVALLVSEPLVIVAHPALPADDVAALIALAKARAGRMTFGSGGQGSTPHMAGQLFAWLSQAPLTHVPYKGNAPAVADVMAGHIDIVFDGVNAAVGHLRSGKLKALGVTGRERSALLPEVATVTASLPGYEVTSWGRHRRAGRHARTRRGTAVRGAPPDRCARGRASTLRSVRHAARGELAEGDGRLRARADRALAPAGARHRQSAAVARMQSGACERRCPPDCIRATSLDGSQL